MSRILSNAMNQASVPGASVNHLGLQFGQARGGKAVGAANAAVSLLAGLRQTASARWDTLAKFLRSTSESLDCYSQEVPMGARINVDYPCLDVQTLIGTSIYAQQYSTGQSVHMSADAAVSGGSDAIRNFMSKGALYIWDGTFSIAPFLIPSRMLGARDIGDATMSASYARADGASVPTFAQVSMSVGNESSRHGLTSMLQGARMLTAPTGRSSRWAHGINVSASPVLFTGRIYRVPLTSAVKGRAILEHFMSYWVPPSYSTPWRPYNNVPALYPVPLDGTPTVATAACRYINVDAGSDALSDSKLLSGKNGSATIGDRPVRYASLPGNAELAWPASASEVAAPALFVPTNKCTVKWGPLSSSRSGHRSWAGIEVDPFDTLVEDLNRLDGSVDFDAAGFVSWIVLDAKRLGYDQTPAPGSQHTEMERLISCNALVQLGADYGGIGGAQLPTRSVNLSLEVVPGLISRLKPQITVAESANSSATLPTGLKLPKSALFTINSDSVGLRRNAGQNDPFGDLSRVVPHDFTEYCVDDSTHIGEDFSARWSHLWADWLGCSMAECAGIISNSDQYLYLSALKLRGTMAKLSRHYPQVNTVPDSWRAFLSFGSTKLMDSGLSFHNPDALNTNFPLHTLVLLDTPTSGASEDADWNSGADEIRQTS